MSTNKYIYNCKCWSYCQFTNLIKLIHIQICKLKQWYPAPVHLSGLFGANLWLFPMQVPGYQRVCLRLADPFSNPRGGNILVSGSRCRGSEVRCEHANRQADTWQNATETHVAAHALHKGNQYVHSLLRWLLSAL